MTATNASLLKVDNTKQFLGNNTQNNLLSRQIHLDLWLKIDKEINFNRWNKETKQILNPHNKKQENM